MVREISERKEKKDRLKCLFNNNSHMMCCGVIVLLIIAYILFGSIITGKASKSEVGEKTTEFLNSYFAQSGATAQVELKSVEKDSGLYKVNMLYDGNEMSVYVTEDGKYIIPSQALSPLSSEQQVEETAEIQTSDNPTAELYIFSYCPAGTSALDSFADAGKILYDVADMKVKFFSEMHGEHEKQQNIIQECIQIINSVKYWDYAADYYDSVYTKCASSRDVSCDKNESTSLMKKVGIDSKKVFECVEKQGETLYTADKEDASALSLQYSPSVVINGVYVANADRTPEGLKTLICNAFNTAPEKCSTSLSEQASSSSGSCS